MKITEDDYVLIKDYCGSWKTLVQISELLNVARTTARRMMRSMEEAGFILKSEPKAKDIAFLYISSPSATDARIRARFKKQKKQKKIITKPEARVSNVRIVSFKSKEMQDKLEELHRLVSQERSRPRVYVASTANMI